MSRSFFSRLHIPIYIFVGITMTAGLRSSGQIKSETPVSPHRNIKILPLVDERASFPDVLKETESEAVSKNAFVIRNLDDREIVAMSALCTITDSQGRQTRSHFMIDRFSSIVPNDVLPSHGSIIITPHGWLQPIHYYQMKASGFALERTPDFRVTANRLKSTAKVSVTIDSIVYSDGEVWGPNSRHIDTNILERRNAAVELSAEVNQFIKRGEDWKPFVTLIAQSQVSTKDDFRSTWKRRYANDLIRWQGDPMQLIKFYEKLPVVPNFHASNEDVAKP